MLVRIFYAYEGDFAFITISETDPSLSTALFSALHTKSCVSSIICPYSLFNSARNFFVLIIIGISYVLPPPGASLSRRKKLCIPTVPGVHRDEIPLAIYLLRRGSPVLCFLIDTMSYVLGISAEFIWHFDLTYPQIIRSKCSTIFLEVWMSPYLPSLRMFSSYISLSTDAEQSAGAGSGDLGALNLTPEPWAAFLAIDFLLDRRGLSRASRCVSFANGKSRTRELEGPFYSASVRGCLLDGVVCTMIYVHGVTSNMQKRLTS